VFGEKRKQWNGAVFCCNRWQSKMLHYHLHANMYRSWILLQFSSRNITMSRHVAAKTKACAFQYIYWMWNVSSGLIKFLPWSFNCHSFSMNKTSFLVCYRVSSHNFSEPLKVSLNIFFTYVLLIMCLLLSSLCTHKWFILLTVFNKFTVLLFCKYIFCHSKYRKCLFLLLTLLSYIQLCWYIFIIPHRWQAITYVIQ